MDIDSGPPCLRAWDDTESSGAAPSHGPRQAAVASGGLGENMGFSDGESDDSMENLWENGGLMGFEGQFCSTKPHFCSIFWMLDGIFSKKTMRFLQICP